MVSITSNENKIVKHTKKLLTSGGRKEFSQFIIEGKRLVYDAIENGADIEYIFVMQGTALNIECSTTVYEVAEKIFDSLKTTVNSQGILAVVNIDKKKQFEVCDKENCYYLYLDGIADPGNMGTIIRTADACGADGVLLSKNCVDIYNPKVVRSTMASIFNVPIFFDDEKRSIISKLKSENVSLISGSLDGKKSPYDIDFKQKSAVVIGNEANGITDEIIALSDELIKIHILGKAESLNAAVAAAVISYERLRQNL